MQGHPVKLIENTLPIDELLSRAGEGDADCLYWAGIRYFQGEGVPRDLRRAVELCEEAARQFHVRAITFIAYCRFRGIELSRDVKAAVLLYRYAAEEGYAPAQHTLGNLYLAGKVLRRNLRLGLRWLGRAADQGDIEALVKLGDLYYHGADVVEDPERACGFYRRAADLGSAYGQYMYGSFLMKGVAVERNPVAALDLLDRAAEGGCTQAKEVKEYFDEYIRFDPAEGKVPDLPLKHPVPLHRSTVVIMTFLRRPCYRAMARDLYEYAESHPGDRELALDDAAALLRAASEQGGVPLTFLT